MLTKLEQTQFMKHFSKKFSKDIVDYVDEVVFQYQRYLFVRRERKQQYAYCTYCRKEHEVEGMKHGESRVCPGCESRCTVKASGLSRKHMVDYAYFVYYEKSKVNSNAIVARGISVSRNYSGDYKAFETKFSVRAMYLFEPGHSQMVDIWSYTWDMKSRVNLHERRSVHSLFGGAMAHTNSYCSYESIKKAVEGTPFQYSTWDAYTGGDMVKFFDLAAKYPCVEYLTKLGFDSLVTAKLNGYNTFGVVNWRGKKPLQVLRMSKQNLNTLRASNFPIRPWTLYLWHASKRDSSHLSDERIVELSQIIGEHNGSHFKKALKYTALHKLVSYFDKQLKKPQVRKYYNSYVSLLSTWNDYIKDCITLEFDVSRESVLFPKNLYNAHQNTLKQVKLHRDELLDRKIWDRSEELQKYRFEANGMFIRPAESTQELINEGKALNHCVGTYADNYAKGKCSIFVIRTEEAPDKPFFTVEMRIVNKVPQIHQCRGNKNSSPPKDVQAFVDLFTETKLQTKKRERVGVAV